jgi:hypothetical protein
MGVTATAIGDWLGTFFATDAGVAAGAGAADAGVGLTAAESAGLGASLDASTAAALSTDAAAIAGGTDAALGAGAVGTGVGAGASLGEGEAGLQTINIGASSLAGAGAGGGGGSGFGALGVAAPGAASMLLPSGGSVTSPNQVTPAQKDTSFIPTNSADPQVLGNDLQNLLGVQDQLDAATPQTLGQLASNPGISDISFDPNSASLGADTINSPNTGQDLLDWFKNPKNLATAGLLGMSAGNILNPAKLPPTARTAAGIAGPEASQAQAVIASGGTAGPAWAQQKASIDATINEQIQQQTEALMQAAANSGMQGPGVPTGVTQQQIATMTSQLNTQRQQLYEQALAQNVNEAISELTGANSVLMGSANLQYQEDLHAQELALQAAALAAKLYALSG